MAQHPLDPKAGVALEPCNEVRASLNDLGKEGEIVETAVKQ
jgi:hypothetical protein